MTRWECDVMCSCGTVVASGASDTEAGAAYNAGIASNLAFRHAHQGHSLRLVSEKVTP